MTETKPTPEQLASRPDAVRSSGDETDADPHAWLCRWCEGIHRNTTGRCDAPVASAAEIATQAQIDAAREACTPEMLAAADGYVHVVIATLRSRLEQAERERDEARKQVHDLECNLAWVREGKEIAERAREQHWRELERIRKDVLGGLDYARATEAERLLANIACSQDALIAAMRQRRSEEQQTEVREAEKYLDASIDLARKHLSTLPGSKEKPDAVR